MPDKFYKPPLVIRKTLLKIIFCLAISIISGVLISKAFFYISLILLFLLFSKQTAIGCIHLYQRYAPIEIRARCCMVPSCSQYSIMAIERYGVIIGLRKTYSRLKRCKPPGGEDFP